MILDRGMCTICTKGTEFDSPWTDGTSCWYGELDYGSSPADSTDYRLDETIERRIRILQDRTLTGLHGIKIDGDAYTIVRVYHGTDRDNGQPISDLTLRRVNTGVQANA